MVPGAVLAAGRSSRMGRSKALLPFGRAHPLTFLQRVAESMQRAGLEDILIVGRENDAELIRSVERLSVRTEFIPNVNHERGQLTSIVAAVNAVDHPGVRGLLIMPVDMPLVRAETFARLLQAFAASPTSIVRPVHCGRHGHPVIFDRSSFDPLRRADPAVGAKSVLQSQSDRVLNVEIDDEGVLADIDSVEEYVAVFGGPPESFETGMPS
ncbi:MAG: nucleotidyltransferase family protein [Vicinamibacterales bacterium]